MTTGMRAIYAASAMVFCVVVMVGVLVFGSEAARSLILWSALIAAWAQFAAQDRRAWALVLSIVLAYGSMALAALALVFL